MPNRLWIRSCIGDLSYMYVARAILHPPGATCSATQGVRTTYLYSPSAKIRSPCDRGLYQPSAKIRAPQGVQDLALKSFTSSHVFSFRLGCFAWLVSLTKRLFVYVFVSFWDQAGTSVCDLLPEINGAVTSLIIFCYVWRTSKTSMPISINSLSHFARCVIG